MGYFISGLKPKLQWDIIPWQLESITKAVRLALLYEEKPLFADRLPKYKSPVITEISSLPRLLGINTSTYASPSKLAVLPPSGLPPMALPSPSSVATKTPVPSNATTSSQFRKMSFQEMQ